MKKIIILGLVLVFTLSACSLDEVVALLVTPTPPRPSAPSATATPTVFQTPTNTPTITLVPTFTTTPTLVGAMGGLPVDDADGTGADTNALPTLYVVPTVTSAPKTTLFGGQDSIIMSIGISSDILFWGYCDAPHYVDFDVRLANTLRVTYVLLFWRLVDKGGNQSTAWGGGAIMEQVKGGYFTYRVRPENIVHYDEFKDAWIEYQVVVATYGLKTLARSDVFRQELSLQKCITLETDE